MARPIKCTPEKLGEVIERMIDECEANGTPPTDYVLMRECGIRKRVLDSWYSGEADEKLKTVEGSYQDELEILIEYRCDWLIRGLMLNPKDTNKIYLSKQKRWGGLEDVQKSKSTGKQTLEITLKGADGKSLI